ncbi:uncharacterized protein LOC106170924 [Lingula anatina]|uniref:Uncharacterized protein LOC106170924 n=1 Tax=Lingula anatina TaxID=7574 RepID=A0A1S3J991_LINAN|nr:uncharacterized protein LOC106170924 [Lingula anatina]|eukprot:XP_013406439.1 uncharacterized protein LOC106170924 [Lingula anatina]
MPSFCAVFGCSNRRNRENDRSYYRLPKVITHQGDQTKELSQARRDKWLSNIGRSDIKESSYEHIRVCSDHFVGKPAALYDKLNPDWAPTVKMGRPSDTENQQATPHSRYSRSVQRSTKMKQHEAATALLDLQKSGEVAATFEMTTNVETGTASQTTVDMKLYTAMEEEIMRLQSENAELKKACKAKQFDIDFFENDDEKVRYYTGLPNYPVLKSLYDYIETDIILHHKSVLDKFQQLILVLMKLRLNLANQDLAVRFGVSDSTVSRIFRNILGVLFVLLSPLIHWPEREQLKKTMPMSFREHFGTKVAVIIDCFEIPMECPSNLKARNETWSSYKHNNTAKYLIGITPQGVICFISDGHGGRASDKIITETCGLLNKLLPGDVILADRGFDIQDSVGSMCARLYIPAFTRGKSQLGALDVEQTRRIANSRIHVERVIGVVRQKYSILSANCLTIFLHQ